MEIQTNPRKNPTQKRARFTVDVLIKATARVLVRDGYDRASTNRIAKEAGISIGSLYQYFPSKEALVAALFEKQIEYDKKTIEADLAAFKGRCLDSVVPKVIETMLTTFKKNSKLKKVLIQQVPRVGRLEYLRYVRHEVAHLFMTYISNDTVKVRKQSLEVPLFLLVNAVEAILYAAIFENPDYVDETYLKNEVSDLVLRYLCP